MEKYRWNMTLRVGILSFIVMSIANSCTNNDIINTELNDSDIVNITGCTVENYTDTTSSRGNNGSTDYIYEGECISFFSKGGITAGGRQLTLRDGKWYGMDNSNWNNEFDYTDYCAFYPEIYSNGPMVNIQEYLYTENGELKDILFCKGSTPKTNNIVLHFSHLFSKLRFTVDGNINKDINHISVNIPYMVSGIDTYNGSLSYENNKTSEISVAYNEDGIYDFIIPSGISMSISYKINGKDNNLIYSGQTESLNFNSGSMYITSVKKSQANGIYTTEDFIAFTNLINGYNYKDRKLEEFYVMENGVRVFNLYSDLTFTENECKDIMPIGMKNEFSQDGFNDTFNGNNFNLKSIKINTDRESDFYSIFYQIGKNGNVNRINLWYTEINETKPRNYSRIGVLAGINYGTINLCDIIGTKFNTRSDSIKIAGFVHNNYGIVANSSITNVSFASQVNLLGIFAYTNYNMLVNSFIKSKPVNMTKTKYQSVIAINNVGKIYNFMVKSLINEKFKGTVHFNDKNCVLYNCVIPKGSNNTFTNNNNNVKIITYNHNSSTEYNKCIDMLNKWVDNESHKLNLGIKIHNWN